MSSEGRKSESLGVKVIHQISNIRWMLKGVKVYALVGKSGTGKSFRAKLIAERHSIDIIVDDGLIIYHNKILAGKSAKNEKYSINAVRVAIFDEASHRQEAISALEHVKFKRILLLGTSDRMVEKIADRLNLPEIFKTLRIEDISTPEEIALAKKNRSEGKHVIPVPVVEIQQRLPHLIYDRISLFFKSPSGWFGKNARKEVEKTVVRPQFQDGKRGAITISEAAISQMVLHCVQEFDRTIHPEKVKIRRVHGDQFIVRLTISTPYKAQMSETLYALQAFIVRGIEKYTGIMLKEVHISIGKIIR
ncbi:ATP-binding cassette domain-containing protein [Entomospira nematocerorum]|nr:ATP-binding cassette domain-containing protein [Entomospira nematocera]WDI34494.1 ATP-binding cassette domain-containing protein [Entomospira nematocera]